MKDTKETVKTERIDKDAARREEERIRREREAIEGITGGPVPDGEREEEDN